MEYGNVESSERDRGVKKGRVRRSCEACRATKGKCVGVEGEKRCQRCAKEGGQCVYLEARPRPKRARNSRVRVAEMEEKLDGLLALLAQRRGVPADSSSAPSMPTPTPSLSLPETDTQAFSQTFTASSSSSSPRPNTLPFFPPVQSSGSFASPGVWTTLSQRHGPGPQQMLPVFLFPNFDPFNDVISKGLIPFEHAERSLQLFKSKASQFPFVLAPPNTSLDTLRRDRPFLLLAILAFAESANEKLQLQLELELRETLSKKVIVHGEKSLDILQGVLLYLAWYHFYFDPAREQIYQLSQMATAIAIDLGINKPSKESAPAHYRMQRAKTLVFLAEKSPEELEEQRAFLGCYFLTSSICNGLRKPNSLKYCDYMDACCESLVHAANAETDHLLPYHMRLQRLGEAIEQAFDYSQTHELPQLDTMRTEILVKAFEQQLSQIESTFPPHVWNNAAITMRFYNLRIYVNEVAFHAVKPSETEPMSSISSLRSWYHSAARHDCLVRCVQHAKEYLDRYLALSSDDLSSFIMPDFISLVYALLIIGAFATGAPDSPILDKEHMKEIANLDYYLDVLSSQALQVIALSKAGSNGYMGHIYQLFQQTKGWFVQTTDDPTPFPLCKPGFSFMDIIPTVVGRCVDYGVECSENSSGPSEMSSEEQWTEMLSSWGATQEMSNTALDAAMS